MPLDGVELPVGLALGSLGLAQQGRALPHGEDSHLGVVTQALGLSAPSAGAGETTRICDTLEVVVTLYGELLNRERPARRLPAGWVEEDRHHYFPGCPGEASSQDGQAAWRSSRVVAVSVTAAARRLGRNRRTSGRVG